MKCTSHLVQLYAGFSLLLKACNHGEQTCQRDIITWSCDYFIDLILCPRVVFIYLIILSQLFTCFLSLCALHTLFHVQTHYLWATSYQWWLLIFFLFCYFFESNWIKDKNRKFFKSNQNTFKQSDPCEACVCVFVLRCSASVTVASHSWMLYLMQDFTCVYISFTPVHSLKKRQNNKKKKKN